LFEIRIVPSSRATWLETDIGQVRRLRAITAAEVDTCLVSNPLPSTFFASRQGSKGFGSVSEVVIESLPTESRGKDSNRK
jgi:hypothetical protein